LRYIAGWTATSTALAPVNMSRVICPSHIYLPVLPNGRNFGCKTQTWPCIKLGAGLDVCDQTVFIFSKNRTEKNGFSCKKSGSMVQFELHFIDVTDVGTEVLKLSCTHIS
jgi:hypothetical protein